MVIDSIARHHDGSGELRRFAVFVGRSTQLVEVFLVARLEIFGVELKLVARVE